MNVQKLIDELRKYNKTTSYDDYMMCESKNRFYYIFPQVDMIDGYCHIWLEDEFHNTTPRSLVRELMKYPYQKDWPVRFVDERSNLFTTVGVPYILYNNLILRIKE